MNSKFLLFLVSPSISDVIDRYIMFECFGLSFEDMQAFSDIKEISPWSNSVAR